MYASPTLAINGADNGLSPARRQAIILTNEVSLPLGANFSQNVFEIETFYLRKGIWKCRLRNCGHFVSASLCWHQYGNKRIVGWPAWVGHVKVVSIGKLKHNSTETLALVGKPSLNTLRPRQICRHFSNDIFKWIFPNGNVRISPKIRLKVFLRFESTIFQHWLR